MTARFPLLTVFGLGRIQVAPGTWGSMPTVALAGLLMALGAGPQAHPVMYHAVLLVWIGVFSYSCVSQGDAAEAHFNAKDPSAIVADEAAGQALPLMLLPAGAVESAGGAVFVLVFAFLAFRVMDIVKPAPARQIQSAPSGWGILLDDLVAGVYAAALVQVVTRLA